MRPILAVSSLLLALALVGCKGNSLEGKWNATGSKGMPPGSTATMEFVGGRSTLTVDAKQPQIGEMIFTAVGPYKLEGDKLTLTPESVTFDDSKITDPRVKAVLANPTFKDGLTKGMKKNSVYTVKFDSSDQVLLTTTDGNMTLTRVK